MNANVRPLREPPSRVARRFAGIEVGALAAFALVAALILAFGYLAAEVMEGDTAAFDRAVIMAFRTGGNPADPIGPPWLEEMGRDVTALGSYAFLSFVLIAVLGYLLLVGKRAMALLLAVAVIGGAVLSTFLKIGFDRPRPDLPHAARVFTASFPSGHATLSAITFLTLGAILTRVEAERRVKVYFVAIAVFLTVMVGVSRIYLGLHYPTDVIAGWAIGAAWAILCWAVALYLQQHGQVEQPREP